MDAVKSPEELYDEKLATMPIRLRELTKKLGEELTRLYLKWKNYRALFANHETVGLLNKAAPAFFGHLQRVLWQDILLHLCRITGPRKSMGHANLTIGLLGEFNPDPKQKARVQKLVTSAIQKSEFARDVRNRRLAHIELPPDDGTPPVPLASGSRKQVENALAAIRDALLEVERWYLGSTTRYESPIDALGGAECFLECLQLGVECRERAREVRRGKRTASK